MIRQLLENVLVTGCTGFVGRGLVRRLQDDGKYSVVGAVRSLSIDIPYNLEVIDVGNLTSNTDWAIALEDISVVIHAAARAHIMKDQVASPLAEYRKVNVEGTMNLAKQAVRAGVRRFIFISSIKVNGEGGLFDNPYRVDDAPAPVDPYAISKMEAELGLYKLSTETNMEVVIIRPPLVYGPGVKANFLSMMRWLNKGIPLPLGAIKNKRSIVALDNLVDLIVTCIDHPAAANQTFLAGDGEDLSTPELLRRMSRALGRSVRLIPVPVPVLKFGAALLGKPAVAQRLCGSLQVDISKARDLLGWTPPVSVDDALQKTADAFLSDKR